MNRQKYFYEEFVIGLGFTSGLWLAVGIDPEAIIFDSLLNVVKAYTPYFKFGFIFYLLPIIVTVLSLWCAYLMGGNVGVIGVACAFLGGLLILIYPLVGIVLFIIGGYLGNLGVEQVISSKEYV